MSSQRFIFGQGYGRQLVVSPGTRGLKVSLYVTPNAYTWYHVDSSAEIPIGEWTHLVGTWDGSYLTLYVNGAFDRQAAASVVPWDSGCAFTVGGNYNVCGYSGQYFQGRIDEVTLYSSALTPSDVAALYNAGSAGKCATPTVTSAPVSGNATVGDGATLQVSATGGALNYQWALNGQDISGQTGATLYIQNLAPEDGGNEGTYTVHVWNDAGSITSAGTVLTAVDPVPVAVPNGVVAGGRVRAITKLT